MWPATETLTAEQAGATPTVQSMRAESASRSARLELISCTRKLKNASAPTYALQTMLMESDPCKQNAKQLLDASHATYGTQRLTVLKS